MRGVLMAALAGLLVAAGPALAQERPVERLVTRDGIRLDYPPNGVWRAKARRVVEVRAGLRRAGGADQLNAAFLYARAAAPATAVTGVLRFPSILVAFSDTDTNPLPRAVAYDSVFYTGQPLNGRPYTMRTLYEEMSNALFSVNGKTYGWTVAPNLKDHYLEACGSTSNAIDCLTGRTRMRQLFVAALQSVDTGVDFGQYDNNGPDGIPNSADDDGVVDVVQFVQPVVGGECRGRGIWAHKFSLAGLGGGVFFTNDLRPNGQPVTVNAYHIVSGVGGSTCTAADSIMGIGTASHELGHGIGLPDLYDTGGDTEGIGEWGLMGSGNFRSLLSPAHFEAWSKERLGWVVVRELSRRGSYTLGPVVTRDTVFLVRPKGVNPRGEYFLLENKQPSGSDHANMLTSYRQGVGPKIGGLLVWHIDSLKAVTSGFPFANAVNAGQIHGVALLQADGVDDLGAKNNRGDAGDPFPGSANNRLLAKRTTPALLKNHDGSFAGVGLSAIQVQSDSAISFTLSFGLVIRATDTLAHVAVNDTLYRRFNDILDPATTHRLFIASPQTSTDGRARFEFVEWSDGVLQNPRDFTVVDGVDSLVARVNAMYQLRVQVDGSGQVSSSPSLDLQNGTFLASGSAVTLVPSPSQGHVFDSWSGDTTANRDTLRLTMQRPYTLAARFVGILQVAADPVPPALMGAPFSYRIPVIGGTGEYRWQLVSGMLPTGLLLFSNGVLAGTPEQTGAFAIVVRVSSGSQSLERPLALNVVAPVVNPEAVVAHLVDAGDALTADEIRYLDILGNRNGRLDVGDFLAWVEKTGVRPAADVTAAVQAAPPAEGTRAAARGRRSKGGER